MDSLEKLKTLIFEAENCNPQVAERKLNYIVEFIRKEFDDEIYGKPSLEEAIDEINSIKHKLKNKSNIFISKAG